MSRFLAVDRAVTDELLLTSHRALPADPLRRVALVAEEAGEAVKAALDLTRPTLPAHDIAYKRKELRKELVQTVAMGLRVLEAMAEEDATEPNED